MTLFGTSSCHGRTPGGTAACPSDDSLAHLHAASFWLEHNGSDREVTAHLSAARTSHLGSAVRSALFSRLLERIEEAHAQRKASNPAWRAASEQARAELSSWGCLRPDLHEALHRDLPPVSDTR